MVKEHHSEKNESIQITDLSISKRLKEALLRLGFKTLQELKDLKEDELNNISGIGYKSINELKDLLITNSIELKENHEVEPDSSEVLDVEGKRQEESHVLNLASYIEKELSERERFVIYNRVGLYGQEKTLEELGEIMGNITRERVRQIESRGITMLKNAYALGVLEDPLIEEFKTYGDRVSFYSEIELDNKAYPKNCLSAILLNMFSDEYEIVSNSKLGEDKILSRKKLELEKGITDLLAELSETDSLRNLKDLSDIYKVPVHIIKGINGIVMHDGFVGLDSNKNLFYQGVTGKIYATLKEFGRPVKIDEICKKANLSHNQVRGAMERVQDAVNVGLSTYALKEWGYIEGFIPDVAVHYLKQANQPLSFKNLKSLILKQRVVKENSIYPGLSNDGRLVLLDDGYWALSEWGYENVRESNFEYREYEVNATEALMDILNTNKEFMSMRQIFNKIKSKYGERASSSWPTYYLAIQKLKETGDVVEMKNGRYCYYKRVEG